MPEDPSIRTNKISKCMKLLAEYLDEHNYEMALGPAERLLRLIKDGLVAQNWPLALDRIEEVLAQMSEDDRNDAIEALRSRFDERLYTREGRT